MSAYDEAVVLKAMEFAAQEAKEEAEREAAAQYKAMGEAAEAKSQAEVKAERDRADGLQARLDLESAARGRALEELASERTLREGIVVQLERERENSTALNARLEQAIAAATARSAPMPIAPPMYEMKMIGRDINSYPTIRLTPVKE